MTKVAPAHDQAAAAFLAGEQGLSLLGSTGTFHTLCIAEAWLGVLFWLTASAVT